MTSAERARTDASSCTTSAAERRAAMAAPVMLFEGDGLTGVTDVLTTSNTFAILESIHLDLEYGGWIHP